MFFGQIFAGILVGIFWVFVFDTIFLEVSKEWYFVGTFLGAFFGIFIGIARSFESELGDTSAESPTRALPSVASVALVGAFIGALFSAFSGILLVIFFDASAGATQGAFVGISAGLSLWLLDLVIRGTYYRTPLQYFMQIAFGILAGALFGSVTGAIIANLNGALVAILIATPVGAFVGATLIVFADTLGPAYRFIKEANKKAARKKADKELYEDLEFRMGLEEAIAQMILQDARDGKDPQETAKMSLEIREGMLKHWEEQKKSKNKK